MEDYEILKEFCALQSEVFEVLSLTNHQLNLPLALPQLFRG